MKKLIIAAFCIALLAGCRSNHTLVLSDVEISVKDGKVYFSAGYPPFHCKLHVYDLETKEEVLCQELLPLQDEPEGIEIVGDKLYTVFWCAGGVTKIYEFALPIL